MSFSLLEMFISDLWSWEAFCLYCCESGPWVKTKPVPTMPIVGLCSKNCGGRESCPGD